MPDIGGLVRSVEPREVFEEGFHIPLMPLMRDGVPDATLIKLIAHQCPHAGPDDGDIWALAGAVELMEKRLAATLTNIRCRMCGDRRRMFTRSEAAMRAAIRALPDGSYRYGSTPTGSRSRSISTSR